MPAVEDKNLNLQDDFALLDAEPEVKEEEQESKEIEEEIEVEKEEEEEKQPSDEKEEEQEEEPREILPHERPTIAQINKDFPDFFKKFPTLKDAFFREKQFSEVFHSPADAASAAEEAETYRVLREDMTDGTGEKLIPALKESDSLKKFASNFLPNLYKTDKDLHWQVILPIIEDMVRLAFREGSRTKNDNLKFSAQHIADYLLGDSEIAEGKKTLVQKESEVKKSDPERENWQNERYNAFNIDVHESVYNELVREVNKGFKDEEGLTKFMRSSITKAVLDDIVKTIRADKVHTKYLDRLWKEAKSNGFRSEDKTRIINASLARAKSLVPSLRRRLIGEALGSSPLTETKKEKMEEVKSRKEPGALGQPGVNKARTPSARRIDWRKTSDVDFLNDRYELKGKK